MAKLTDEKIALKLKGATDEDIQALEENVNLQEFYYSKNNKTFLCKNMDKRRKKCYSIYNREYLKIY